MEEVVSYEQLRLEKLRRNRQVMLDLGLSQTIADVTPAEKKSAKRKKRQAVDSEISVGPRRRSPRLSETTSSTSPTVADTESDEQEEVEEEQHTFDPSKVLLYSCTDDEREPKTVREGKSFRPIGQGAADTDLRRMYSISFHEKQKIIVGGGHQGRVSVFSATCNDKNPEEILLSFKASRGWVSGTRFIDSMQSGLLITSNDGEMSLWDCTIQNDLMPKRLVSQAMHGKSGIFDLDVFENNFITCSKDGSLCLGTVASSQNKFEVIRRFEDAHDGVVKSVMFQPGSRSDVMCSAGNDATVKVWDSRSDSKKPSQSFASSGNTVINVVKWNPQMNHLILAASFSSTMELFDIRKPSSATVFFKGHLPTACSRASNIYQPVFMYHGKRVVASGGGSKNLTMFETQTGDIVSSGFVGWESGALETTLDGNRLAVSHGSEISFFDCT